MFGRGGGEGFQTKPGCDGPEYLQLPSFKPLTSGFMESRIVCFQKVGLLADRISRDKGGEKGGERGER